MSLVETLKKSLSISSNEQNDITGNSPLIFAKTKRSILKEITSSLENGLLIGIYSKSLGEGMFLVGVSDIERDGPTEIVVFETYDQSGMILNRTRVSVDEIKMV